MDDLDLVSAASQALFHFFADEHRPMLSTRTTKADGQVALPLPHVMREQVDQQSGDAVNKLLRLRKRADVLGHLRMASGIRTKRGNEMRIGQKTHVEEQVGIVGHSRLVTKTHNGDQK